MVRVGDVRTFENFVVPVPKSVDVNPGSAGPRRFRLPIAAGELLVDGGRVSARIVDLETGRTL